MSVRKLPSGRWQAEIYGPGGKRYYSPAARLKAEAQAWEREQRTAFARGRRHDPRAGEVLVSDWRERCRRPPSSYWAVHCEQMWGGWRLNEITRTDARAWVADLLVTRLKGEREGTLSVVTIKKIISQMSVLYAAAMKVDPPLVESNPFERLELPDEKPRPENFYEPDEAERIYAEAARIGSKWRTLIELGMTVGMRPGEIFGLHGHRVDFLRDRIRVVEVMTPRGLKDNPKRPESVRYVKVPHHLIEDMSRLLQGRPRDSLVFTRDDGRRVTDAWFRRHIWTPVIGAAGVRQFVPYTMRHTAASWLAQDGYPLIRLQKLLGHRDFSTTLRYAHLAPDDDDQLLRIWAARSSRTSPVRDGAAEG